MSPVATRRAMRNIPSAPSSVGVYHAAVTWLLPSLGAPLAQAAAFAIVTHAIGVVSFVALGTISLLEVGTSLTGDRPKLAGAG